MKTCDSEACSPHLPFNVEFKVVYAPVHLLERHHNERFAALVETHLPQWPQYREMLKKAPLSHEEWEY